MSDFRIIVKQTAEATENARAKVEKKIDPVQFFEMLTFDRMQYDAVIGHDNLKKKLENSVAENRIGHAQLFTGPEGSGVLPLVLAYACDIIVRNSKNPEIAAKKCAKLAHPDLHFCFPVNTNQSVKKNPRSKHFTADWRKAVLENPYLNLFQWLSLLGIENKQGIINVGQAAEIHEALSLKSMESDYKVMVIWMPETLHEKAANKLLKILEEPARKTVFLLAAEQTEQMLPTILSRTQMLRVPAISSPDMRRALIEKHRCDPRTAETISALAEGNYLRAVQQLGETAETDSPADRFQNWMRILWKKDIYAVLKFVDEIGRAGRVNQKHFLSYGLHIFRECMIMNYASEKLLRTAGAEREFIANFSKMIHADNALQFTDEFETAIYHIERNVNAKLVFTDLSLKCMKLLRVPVKG